MSDSNLGYELASTTPGVTGGARRTRLGAEPDLVRLAEPFMGFVVEAHGTAAATSRAGVTAINLRAEVQVSGWRQGVVAVILPLAHAEKLYADLGAALAELRLGGGRR
jgi:hypothetical protein